MKYIFFLAFSSVPPSFPAPDEASHGLHLFDSNWTSVSLSVSSNPESTVERESSELHSSSPQTVGTITICDPETLNSSATALETNTRNRTNNTSGESQGFNTSTTVIRSSHEGTPRLEIESNIPSEDQDGTFTENPSGVTSYSDIECTESSSRTITVSECSESASAANEGDSSNNSRIPAPSLISDDALPWYCSH